MANTVYSLQVVPRLPAALGRLDDLAENLWFSWRPRVRELFAHLDPDLWLKVEANPKLFLRCLHPDILERAATSEAFLENYHQLLGESKHLRHDGDSREPENRAAQHSPKADGCSTSHFMLA